MSERIVVPIVGMHCRSCELLVEDELCKLPFVKWAKVSQKHANAEIFCSTAANDTQIKQAIVRAGYRVGVADKRSWLNKDSYVFVESFLFLLLIGVMVLIAKFFGLDSLGTNVASPSSLIVVLLIGLTAGVSTCMALVGGLVLGVSARFAEKHPDSTPWQKFHPHLFFNLGRIVSYVVFGAGIAFMGSAFQLSTYGVGLLTLAVGLVMLLMGIQLTGISPRLEDIKLTLPKVIARFFGLSSQTQHEYDHGHAAFLGALTFFLPCGFTQAMQLYAMTTGDPVRGALIMGTFALGTTPGLLGIGGLAALIKGSAAQSLFRFVGVLVVVMGLFNLQNSLNLMGFSPSLSSTKNPSASVVIKDGIQEVRMTQNRTGYSPSVLTIQNGMPVRWIIDSKDIYTCASSIVMPKFGIRKNLQLGENSIEFTPKEVGRIPFSCSMGMYRGEFTVL